MALIPHKADPNFEERMKDYAKDNSRWGGDDMNKGLPPKTPLGQGQKAGLPQGSKS